ncbi:MAG: redoxin domain-containing protein [Haloarculaceae archaeon]
MTDVPVAPEFEAPNVGSGPDPCSLSALAREFEFVALYFMRDHGRTECRQQVRRTRDRYDGFRARDTVPVPVLPHDRETARAWQDEFELPFPLLADAESTIADDYDQPVRLAFASDWADVFGRIPQVSVVDARGPEPRVVWTYTGKTVADRPTTSEVLEAVDEARESNPPRAARP